MGDTLSVLDIAWFIYAHRLSLAGFRWRGYIRVSAHGSISYERARSSQRKSRCRRKPLPGSKPRTARTQAGKTLEMVTGF